MRSRLFLFGRSLSLLCLVTLLFVSCQKEDGAKRFSIFTESYRGTAKVVVDGLSSSWRAGDGIWVNGEQGTVALDDGAPILDIHVTSWGGYYASYPASFVEGRNQNGTLTLTLPQAYQYREDATTHKQLLEMPMVAYTVYDRLEFKHLTGALVVEVPSVNGYNIRLDYIMVRSSTSPLSGTGTVDAGAESPQMVFGSDTTHTVVMYFDRCAVDIAAGAAEKSIMIPVAPTAGNDHKFTVTVCAHTTGSTRKFYFFNKESSMGNLMRNEVAVAPVPSLSSRIIPLVGDGSDGSPYLIQNKVDYKNFLNCISHGDSNNRWYQLVNDIDFGGDTVTAVHSEPGFYGGFNGNGKMLKNVSVQGSTNSNTHYISLFPAMTGGWVKNISISNVRLIAPQNGSFTDVYLGGMTSFVKSFRNGVTFQNIQVSDISFGVDGNLIVSSMVAFGGIVGRLIENYGDIGFLSMESCSFLQTSVKTFSDSADGRNTLCLGGLIGDINGADVTLTDCRVGFGGNQDDFGTEIIEECDNSYVGAAIGRALSNTTRMENSFILEGHVNFTGANNSNVKRVMGSHRIVYGTSVINSSNFYLWKRNNTRNTYTVVRDDF